jgi:hypothetical protein
MAWYRDSFTFFYLTALVDESRQKYWDVPFSTVSGVPVNLLIPEALSCGDRNGRSVKLAFRQPCNAEAKKG